jgi:hypothetical protein
MPQPLLSSFKHHCFHSPRANVHKHPDLYRCAKGNAHATLMRANKATKDHPDYCPASISSDLAKQSGLMDEAGNVKCPLCNSATILVPGETLAEVHVKLCTDETIHYPETRKAGQITEEQFQSWKATLTRDELLGVYARVPNICVMASFTHDETALMTSDSTAFNKLLIERIRERAELALLHQVPYRHTTTSPTISL